MFWCGFGRAGRGAGQDRRGGGRRGTCCGGGGSGDREDGPARCRLPACRRDGSWGFAGARIRAGGGVRVRCGPSAVRAQTARRSGVIERGEWLAGPAGGARFLLGGRVGAPMATDATFAVLHGLYWLAADLCSRGPILIAVDDAHWADGPWRRWLAYVAARLEGLPLTLLVTLRPAEPASRDPVLMAVRGLATEILRPQLLSEHGVATVVRKRLGPDVSEELCRVFKQTSGGKSLLSFGVGPWSGACGWASQFEQSTRSGRRRGRGRGRICLSAPGLPRSDGASTGSGFGSAW